MDGRDDENRNPSGSSPVENTGVTLPAQNPESQAIFTPPTTNETADNLPTPLIAMNGQPLGNPNHNYFAHHPTRTFSSANGDIILDNGAKKPKIGKKPIIIGLIAIIITVVIFIAVYLIVGLVSKPNRADVAEAFDKYADYIQNGKDEVANDGDENSWLIFDLTKMGYSNTEIGKFVNTTREYYTEFYDMTIKSELELAGFLSNSLKNDLNGYKNLLDCLLSYDNMYAYSDQLFNIYNSDGRDAAKDAVDDFLSSNIVIGDLSDDSSVVDYIYANLRQYYSNQLRLFPFYSQYGCMSETGLSMICVSYIYDEEYLSIVSENNFINETIDSLIDVLEPLFRSQTIGIRNALENENEK